MGLFFSKVLDKIYGLGDQRILMLGLDGAGKTTILYNLKLGEVTASVPTIGFNVESLQYKNVKFNLWDIGGQKKIRLLWRHYLDQSNGLIYIIDSTDEERIEEAKEELDYLLSSESLKGVPLLVYANKMDQSRLSVTQVTEQLKLHNVRDREWFIQGSCAINGEGLYEGLEWFQKALKNNAKK